MYIVLLSILGLCCGQSIRPVDSDKHFALLEKGILGNVRQPIIKLVNSFENDMWSKENQSAVKELQRNMKTKDWQKMLNRSITAFFQNHVQDKFDIHWQTIASLNKTLEECCKTNKQLEKVRGLENELYESKLRTGQVNSRFQNVSIKFTELVQAIEDKLLAQSNATSELQNQIQEIELENRNTLNALFGNITHIKEEMGISEGGMDVTGVDCENIYVKGSRENGIYKITPEDSPSSFKVFCDMLDGGWTIVQKRVNGSENFTRSYSEYVNGFGDLNHEFWLGLEKMHQLTKIPRKVKFDFELRNGDMLYLEYGVFQVRDSATQYTLRVERHISGLKSRSFTYNNGKKFVTYDRDNGYKCAKRRYGGWWYDYCTYLNINGKYDLLDSESGMTEHCCGSTYNNFKTTIMKIK